MSHLDALQLVVADDEGGQPGQVAEYVWWQDRDLVVAQIPENENLFVQISQNITSFAYIALSQIRPPHRGSKPNCSVTNLINALRS